MDRKIRVPCFCEVDFLVDFFGEILKTNSPDSDPYELVAIYKFYDFINKQCIICIDDITSFTKKAEVDIFFKKLLKSSTSGGSSIVNYKNDFIRLRHDTSFAYQSSFNSVHLYKNSENVLVKKGSGWCVILSSDFPNGIMTLATTGDIKVSRSIRFNQFQGWDFHKINLPGNALVIADNYLLHEEITYKNNVFKMISAILPLELEGLSYDIAFITSKYLVDPQNKLYILEKFVRELRRSFKINITIYCVAPRDVHDRDIVSNYFRMHSGHSFTYYDNNGTVSKNTTLQLIATASDHDFSIQLLLDEYRSIVSKCRYEIDMFGYRSHRLLSRKAGEYSRLY